jgi:hypothetical protein
MNKRWAILLGRAGTVLMVAAFALFTLSLIPPRAVENTDFRETLNVQPKTFTFDQTFFLTIPVDPQHGFYLNVQANNSVTTYLLNVGREYVQQWITTHFNDTQYASTFNISILEEFLNSHPASLTWKENLAHTAIELQYAPTRVTNITLMFSNPNTEIVKVKYSGKLLNFIVPNERALNPAKVLIPAGFILVLPWLNLTFKRRRTTVFQKDLKKLAMSSFELESKRFVHGTSFRKWMGRTKGQ